jgi:hypothetical protein
LLNGAAAAKCRRCRSTSTAIPTCWQERAYAELLEREAANAINGAKK